MTYPVLISAAGGIDTVTKKAPTFTLFSIAPSKTQQTVNLNPFSTLIAKGAKFLPGGLTRQNVDHMTAIVIKQLNFGLDLTKIPNPLYTPIDKSNIATIVKAGEALAEMIKRTYALLSLTKHDFDLSYDELVDSIAGDLTDGVLDGIGAKNADPLYAAVANIFSAQIAVEVLSNNLAVDGQLGFDAIEQALHTVMPGLPVSASMESDATISNVLLEQARNAVNAVLELSYSVDVLKVESILKNTSPGSLSNSIPTITSASISQFYTTAYSVAGVGTMEQWEIVNQSIRDGSLTGTTNRNNVNRVPVSAVSATASLDASHGPDNIVDGIGWSYWAAYGMPQSITLDLGTVKKIGNVLISFLNYDQDRTYNYSISLSTDSVNWTDAISNYQSEPKRWTENPLSTVETRYVKITITSENNTNWVGILEVEVLEPALRPAPQLPNNPGNSNGNGPIGKNDSVIVLQNSFVDIDVLANDINLVNIPIQVEMYSSPSNGTAVLNADNTVTYTPNINFVGWDSFIYLIIDNNGEVSFAEVFVRIQCVACTLVNINVTFKWSANSDTIDGYVVYYGPTPESAVIPVSIRPVNQAGFNPKQPSVSFDAARDLGLNAGDNACFRLRAYQNQLESRSSDAICISL